MTLVVEENKPFDPVDIGFLGSRAIMPDADRVADLIEKLGFLRRRRDGWNDHAPTALYVGG